MESDARLVWLQERSELGQLSPEILAAIASTLKLDIRAAGDYIDLKAEKDSAVYILRRGQLSEQDGQECLIPGAVINLEAFITDCLPSEKLITISECELWRWPGEQVRQTLQDYPQILQILSQQLLQEVQELTAQLSFEHERQRVLQPYLVPAAKRRILGKSRYANKIRQALTATAKTNEPVLVFGEPGLEKDNAAALIHFANPQRRHETLIKLNCDRLTANGRELFGRVGDGKPSLLTALGKGTLLLNNVQELDPKLQPAIAHLLKTGTYYPYHRPGEPTPAPQTSEARIIGVGESVLPELTPLFAKTIKLSPLRVRKADIDDYAHYYLVKACRATGRSIPAIAPEAIRRLQAYDFPNNVRELQSLIQRALTQLENESVITEEIIWPSQSKKKQYRLNLLNRFPKFRQLFRNPWWPDRINFGFTSWFYALVVAVLFLGPQTRDQNFALNLFWAWWWPLILLGFLFVGRVWCAFCPFMIYGEIAQKLSLRLWPRTLLKWPRQAADTWGGWFLFGLFALILLWEELWDLQNTAYLSAWLLLLITAGAVICSLIFEKRFWCRYLCPIGGMNGLFAKMAITELRAQQGTCSAECTTYQCYKGGPAKGEGQETTGCPLGTHPAQLTDNRDCVLCMTCLKACPHRSVEFNLRPPAIALVTTQTPRSYEVALLLLLLDSVVLRRLPELSQRLDISLLATFSEHTLWAMGILLLPIVVPWLTYQLIPQPSRGQKIPFIELAYGFLPLTLAANFAHYLTLGLGEAGQVLTLIPRTFALNLSWSLPSLTADPAAIAFLQGLVLLGGVLWSMFLTQLLGKQSFWQLLPQHGTLLSFMVICWWVIV